MGATTPQGPTRPPGDYCSFTKAVEHLGDRWSLLIVRELAARGPIGFNAMAASLPGISRSVLARRLRKLEVMGLIERLPSASRASIARPYRLAPAGEDLIPTLLSLLAWSERWVPEDAEMAREDPTVIPAWLAGRVDPLLAPPGPVVLELELRDVPGGTFWLVLERGAVGSVCLDDPGFAPERRVYVETDAPTLLPIARGLREWSSAITDGSVMVLGEPALVRALPRWFRPPEVVGTATGVPGIVGLPRAG